MTARTPTLTIVLLGLVALGAANANAQSDASRYATLTGNVSNVATGNLLEGARVEIKALNLASLSDNTGRYVLGSLPAGVHEVTVSYAGLTPIRMPLEVEAGRSVTRNFDLTDEVYKLAAFKVTGEREGLAAALTAQRNADNVKNVVATDQFGNLPNLNAGEVAMRLPGVVGDLDPAGNSFGFHVRGMPTGLNVVTMDGALMTSQGASARRSVLNNITGTMFDQIEVTKGHRPDHGADSLGGTINLRSRSPLSLREKRRVNYSWTGRLAPSFFQHIPLRRDHPFHQTASLGWQEVFDVFGAERNLGVAVNLFHSKNALAWFATVRDYENTTAQPAYVWDYRTADTYSQRRQNSINVKTDFRLSPRTKLTALVMVADHMDLFRRQFDIRAFTTQQVGTAGTAGILPGYTDRITRVRPAPGSTIEMSGRGPDHFINRTRRVDLGAEHTFGAFEVDYNARRSLTHIHQDFVILLNSITSVGWVLDRTESDLYPQFIQTAGPDMTNPANYRPPVNGLTSQRQRTDQDVDEYNLNVRWKPPTSRQFSVKAGAMRRDQTNSENPVNSRWNYTGTAPLAHDPDLKTFDLTKTGRAIPRWQASMHFDFDKPKDPSVWREDLYFYEQQKYTATRSVTEVIHAGYVMAQARFAGTGILGGVRTERTETESWGWTRARVLSTAAQQAADPVGAAQRDYAGSLRELSSSYTKSFPSIHLTRDLVPNLRGRLSWSTSFGRPALTNAMPNETPNEANRTLTVNNAGLLPQSATNWDASLDYFLKPVGSLSVSFFHKAIKDFIVPNFISGTIGTGNDNGFGGEYPGFTLLRSVNAGDATVRGWELAYSQQLTFLPGLLSGLAVSADVTLLDTHGQFGGTTNLTGNQVPNFVPRSGNASVSWAHRGFSARVLANHTSGYITSYSAASVGRNIYRFPRTVINLGVAYQFRPSLTFTCDVENATNEEQAFYRGIPDQLQTRNISGTTITFGVMGRF